ncbi:helix-turn-helix domain-containing protein [Phaeobacter gallaeciensis]|uniref:Helix-turn-helix domain protein n=2 Tax=Phaeobacter gallaeciensis TaxID=60890 RepID=A0AAC9Z8S2_9RHOB|nr:helix-turn-helix domain-containing protein [Phaeobacter gallaeciensis]AHD09517.1 Helix-turn-helix domain protein [Phaeobacter gallaeciensis DSM 26640]ATE92782.1 Helix-turn-helix domain protein [Phaeobacter gallaeciensis]ATE97396.1 Helix-turn-helix domain protein [Phaeobacter gallaeciensis]ATF01447.1 Helix-turn-helix domain protein [Phaeobacter gallaeciensis]ATF05827.1 Helix-turn-helix domain protein [Phaeobacter gallaeciensis]
MSHKAVSWALEQRHLKPGPWIVLIQLADRHNKDTLQCDPDQKLIAADCNMSRATVNRHLEDLEHTGLIRRIPRVNPRTNKALSTFYILGLNFDNPPEVEFAVSQNETRKPKGQKENKGASRVSNCDTAPSLKNADSRVSKIAIPESQIETQTLVNKPVREHCAADAPHNPEFDFDGFMAEFSAAYPRMGLPEATEDALRAALGEGADPAEILAGARAYAVEQDGNAPRYMKLSENWIAEKRWRQHVTAPKAQADQSEVLAYWAKEILEAKPHMHGRVSPSMARECLSAGLVTEQDCRQVGVSL